MAGAGLVLVLGTCVSAYAAPGRGDVPTCEGRTATIVGTQGQPLAGTSGDDVIVTDGAASVDAGAGDDLVCATGVSDIDPELYAGILGGTGSDTIDTTGTTESLEIGLGTVGGPVTVAGGAGRDEIDVTSSSAHPVATRWTLDDARHRATKNGSVALTWTSVSTFDLAVANGHNRFIGGPSAETLRTETYPRVTSPVRATMGGGDDTVRVAPGLIDVDAGPGTDLLEVEVPSTARFNRHGRTQRTAGFENVHVYSYRSPTVIRGDDRANSILVQSTNCHVLVDGGGGDDVIRATGAMTAERGGCAHPRQFPWTLDGGAGDDTLIGTNHNDVLAGGPGDDHADGRGGIDTCTAEHEVACERS